MPYRLLVPVLALLLAGCATRRANTIPADVRDYVTPTIAVLDFENKAPFPGNWNLGRGMRDQLVDRLVQSRRYTVLEREDLPALIAEMQNQRTAYFRPEGRADLGRLKNVRYLVKGAVTDFTHVAGGGFRAFFSKIGLGIDSHVALVSITLYVIDVESGEILASEALDGRATAGSAAVEATYGSVSFGGNAFYRTPLGKATQAVLGQAVERVSTTIARERWTPRIIKQEDGVIYVSGGTDRALRADTLYEALAPGEPLVDPATGDLLGRTAHRVTGRLRLTAVQDRWSTATLVDGECLPGQQLRPAAP
jgi:curli biogenesis system outer membrane secretion channel CsgG